MDFFFQKKKKKPLLCLAKVRVIILKTENKGRHFKHFNKIQSWFRKSSGREPLVGTKLVWLTNYTPVLSGITVFALSDVIT
jgi:hypothetical protein